MYSKVREIGRYERSYNSGINSSQKIQNLDGFRDDCRFGRIFLVVRSLFNSIQNSLEFFFSIHRIVDFVNQLLQNL